MIVTGSAKGGPSTEVLRSIAAASEKTGISFDYLLSQARRESSFNPSAKAPTSSASGLYQFTKATWLATVQAHGADHGLTWAADAIQRRPDGSYAVADAGAREAILDLRNDPGVAAQMAADLAADNSSFLAQKLGREVTPTDLALSHFLGAQGAARLLTALEATPDASAAPLFPEAAAANQSVFFAPGGAPRSLAEIHAAFEPGAGGSGTNPQVMPSMWTARREVHAEARPASDPEQLPGIEPMPKHLSLSFAQDAYRRLAAMGSGE
jgi:hypothetical protein